MSEWSEAVLDVVDRVPPGRVTTYGLVAEAVRERLGRGTARQVGTLLATQGAAVPWWRVVRVDGTLPEPLRERTAEHYAAEGTAVRDSGSIDIHHAVWDPLEDTHA